MNMHACRAGGYRCCVLLWILSFGLWSCGRGGGNSGDASGNSGGGVEPTIPSTYFGMHDNHGAELPSTPYPTVTFGAYRLWDSGGASQWALTETSRGVYNWTA